MTKDQAKPTMPRPLIVRKVGISAGSKGGSLYPENCHHNDGFRIDYSFPNCKSAGEWQVCQDTMALMIKRFNCHDELIEALEMLLEFENNLPRRMSNLMYERAKQALAKAEAN